jgi:hypothetical protein
MLIPWQPRHFSLPLTLSLFEWSVDEDQIVVR